MSSHLRGPWPCAQASKTSWKALRTEAEGPSLRTKYIAAAGFAALAGVASLLILYKLVVQQDAQCWVLLGICTLLVVVSNFLVAVQFRTKIRRAVVTGIFAGVLLLSSGEILSNGQYAQSLHIMEKLGAKNAADLVRIVLSEGRGS